jgi:hypothetical protein
VISVITGGKITNAQIVQMSHVFSQAHSRVYFIGSVKLPFITPATTNRTIAAIALFMSILSGEEWDALENFTRSRRATQSGMAEKTIAARQEHHRG